MADLTRVGKTLFGNPTRLRLALWVRRRDKRFFQSQPPRSIGMPSAVRQEIDKLVELGMLDRQQPPDDKRIYYERTDSPLWEIIAAADRVLGSPGFADDRPE